MPIRCQDGVVWSQVLGTQDRICHNISGRSCRISWVGNYRFYMPTTHQEETSGSHWFETPDRTGLLRVRTALNDLTGSYMPTRYPDGAARSHGFGTPNRTCLEVSGRGCRISRVRNIRSQLLLTRYQDRAAGSQGFGYQIEHAYEVSGRGCRILRVRTDRFKMPARYQVGAAGPHG